MAKFTNPHAFSDRWDAIDNEATVAKFITAFGGELAALPGQLVIEDLRALGTATIELLEDRQASSVYRIRQTGEVYQVDGEEGKTFHFDTYEDYLSEDPFDEPVTTYIAGKLPNYTVTRVDKYTIYAKRNNPPRCAFTLDERTGDVVMVEVLDSIEPDAAAKLMGRIGYQIQRFLQNEKRNR